MPYPRPFYFIFFMLLAACAPPKAKVVAEANKLPTPPPRESARPALAEAKENAAKAAAEAQRARDNVDRAKLAAETAQQSLRKSLEEVRRLLAQRSAAESELQLLYTQLQILESEISLLIEDITQAKVALELEKKISANTRERLNLAESLTIEKEAEVAELRRLLAYSETLTAQATSAAQEAVNTAEKLRLQVGVEKGRASIWMRISMGLGAALLLAIGAHILRSYMRI